MSLIDFFRPRADGRAEPVEAPRIEPMVDSPPPMMSPGMKRLTALVGAAALGMVAVVGGFEGKSNDPYRDLVGVWTVCAGETRVPMRRYSNAECEDMLANGLADFAGPVLKRNPELRGHDPQLIAATSLAYNAGTAAYNRSMVARRFNEGRWVAACDAFRSWVYAGGRRVQGLVIRREKERAICLRNIPADKAR